MPDMAMRIRVVRTITGLREDPTTGKFLVSLECGHVTVFSDSVSRVDTYRPNGLKCITCRVCSKNVNEGE